MAKSSSQFLCSECGWSGSKWFGRCPNCGEWGTIEEFHEARVTPTARGGASRTTAAGAGVTGRGVGTSAGLGAVSMKDLMRAATDTTLQPAERIPTGFSEYDRVLGGGIVPGAVILMAGEPGVGKSTLLLETAGHVAATVGVATVGAASGESGESGKSGESGEDEKPASVLYISGEESLAQIRMRAMRIGAMQENLLLASTTDLDTVVTLIAQEKPALAIVDSAQTIHSSRVDGIPGGSTQVREVATALIDVAKAQDIPLLLVGHVTKDGSIAGPRTLEHLVDVVCQFEGDPQTALRLLRAVKNRFGPTDEVGCFDMSGEGIEEVKDPSGLFMSDGTDAENAAPAGTCVSFTIDGHRSLPIEVQTLVTDSVLPAPRRATNGVDTNRLAMLVAVLYRHAHVNLLGKDLYVSTIAGGQAKEPACDLAIVAALASAAAQKPIPRTTAAIGEISLTGQVRPVPRIQHRIREAARLGFTRILVPRARGGLRYERPGEVSIVEVSSLADVVRELKLS
ncbi:DNA repair protein RadA [Alloscardovia macacae]|uniref:DNA repair protein RadA n=1 Tax=Alloscardovia macacae TaxID=1160091 RepID=A0A261F795_9BIFI|nr:AAA family ATPase [Alloscardovia macacae]OZG54935.1 DNA repair protein RadA [Alloscardovia macacae]